MDELISKYLDTLKTKDLNDIEAMACMCIEQAMVNCLDEFIGCEITDELKARIICKSEECLTEVIGYTPNIQVYTDPDDPYTLRIKIAARNPYMLSQNIVYDFTCGV